MSPSNYKLKTLTAGLAASLCLISTTNAFASAFGLWEYNGADIGNYNAGGAAIAEDASTNFTNPAGLTRIKHAQVVVSGDPVTGHSDFKGRACGGLTANGTGTPPNAAACAPTLVEGDDGGTFAVVPAMYVSVPINDRWYFGLGMSGPFGLKTDYGRNTPVRYSATRSEIFTININPNVAFEINKHWSVGVGFNALYLNAALNQSLNLYPNGGLLPVTPALSLPVAPQVDSDVENHADDWGYGWDAGVLWQYDDNSRVGLSYRSQVVVKPTGTSKVTGGSATQDLRTTDAKTKIALPPTTMLSGYHKFNPHWAVMATVAYTEWSTIKNIVLNNAVVPDSDDPFELSLGLPSNLTTNTVVGSTDLPQDFRNTWRGSIGVDYMPAPNWRVRAGAGFDQSPVKDKLRTVRLPDNNRYALAVGAGYTMNENIRLDAGYEHIFIEDGDINQTSAVASTIGKSDNSADVFGFQATLTFT